MSQEELAAKLGVASNTVSRWETAAYRPGLNDLHRIAKMCGSPASFALFVPGFELKAKTQVVFILERKI
jgi:transcriptional regulator with XRE-family HTH domain